MNSVRGINVICIVKEQKKVKNDDSMGQYGFEPPTFLIKTIALIVS